MSLVVGKFLFDLVVWFLMWFDLSAPFSAFGVWVFVFLVAIEFSLVQ